MCIPTELYERTLSNLDDSHKVIKKMQILAKAHIYWPGIDASILDYVKRCTICTRFKVILAVQPMLPRNISNRPWQELATDYFTHNGKEYLLTVDTFSKYPFIHRTHFKTSDNSYNTYKTLFHNTDCPNDLSPTMDPPFCQKP